MLGILVFVASTIFCLVLCMLMSKTEEPLNGYYVVCLAMLIFLGVICCIGGIYRIIRIPINIDTLGIGIVFLDIFFLLCLIKKKKVQKYYWPKMDLFGLIVVSGITLAVSVKIYGYELALTFYNSDPAIHFGNAMDIVRTEQIQGMYFTPLINAIFIEVCSLFLPVIKYYKAFILADVFMHILEATISYCFFSYIGGKERKQKIISLVVSILYICGYPLYSFCIGGFFYWSNAAMLFMALIWMMILLTFDKYRVQLLSLIALFSFCIAICYMPFIPLVVLCDFVAILFLYRDEKKILIKLLLPAVLIGLIIAYFLLEQFRGSISLIFQVMQGKGGIYGTLSSDIIFFFPVLLLLIFYRKNIERYGKIIVLLDLSIVSAITLALCICCIGFLSAYYFYKLYYILWFMGWASTRYLINVIEDKKEKRIIYYSLFSTMFLTIFLSFFNVEDNLAKRDPDLLKFGKNSIFSVYSVCDEKIKEDFSQNKYPTDKLMLYNYVIEECDYEVPLITSLDRYADSFWFCSITGKEAWRYYEWTDTYEEIIEKLNKEGINHMLVLYDTELYVKNREKIDDYYTIFENPSGKIVSWSK